MLESAFIDTMQIHPEAATAQPARVGIMSVQGLGSPAPRQDVFELPRRHGQSDHTAYYTGRVLDVQGRIWADTDDDVIRTLDKLKGFVRLGSTHKFLFRRPGVGDDEYLTVKVASPFEWEAIPRRHLAILWAVQFLAADPRMYSNTLKSNSYDPTTTLTGAGVAMPLTLPLVFTGGSALLQAHNQGNFPSPPILTVNGPVTDPVIHNTTTGKKMEFNIALASNDELEVDVLAREIKLNGTLRNDLLDVPNSEWWELDPVVNQLQLTGTGMAASDTLLTVSFRDARI